MTTVAKATPDYVTAEAFLDLVDVRSHRLEDSLRDTHPSGTKDVGLLLETVLVRSRQLRSSLRHTNSGLTIEIASSLLHVIESLENDLRLAGATATTTEAAELDDSERQLRSWLGALDNLRVQSALGHMEARDSYDAIADRSRRTWQRVVQRIRSAGGDVELARHEIRGALDELRTAVRDTIAPDS